MSHAPRELVRVKDQAFRVVWDDGHVSTYPARYLRRHCACAFCRDEVTGRTLLDPTSVPEDLKSTAASTVGRYALRFDFSDGHSTGIYPFPYLRSICPCPECAPAGA